MTAVSRNRSLIKRIRIDADTIRTGDNGKNIPLVMKDGKIYKNIIH